MTDKLTLKNWFKTGLKPLQEQFWAWMDSYWHKGEKIPITAINDIENILNAKADAEGLTNFIAKANIVPLDKMQVFKRKTPEDEDYQPGQQEEDFCVGIVWDSEGNKKWIQGTYLGGDIKAAESYEYDTAVNF